MATSTNVHHGEPLCTMTTVGGLVGVAGPGYGGSGAGWAAAEDAAISSAPRPARAAKAAEAAKAVAVVRWTIVISLLLWGVIGRFLDEAAACVVT